MLFLVLDKLLLKQSHDKIFFSAIKLFRCSVIRNVTLNIKLYRDWLGQHGGRVITQIGSWDFLSLKNSRWSFWFSLTTLKARLNVWKTGPSVLNTRSCFRTITRQSVLIKRISENLTCKKHRIFIGSLFFGV